MMSKCLLHKSKLEDFKRWMDEHHIEHRPGKGSFQVLQVKIRNKRKNVIEWQCVFDRLEAPEHYTVAWPLEGTVRKFINDSRKPDEQQCES
jgi:hypothetical protein